MPPPTFLFDLQQRVVVIPLGAAGHGKVIARRGPLFATDVNAYRVKLDAAWGQATILTVPEDNLEAEK